MGRSDRDPLFFPRPRGKTGNGDQPPPNREPAELAQQELAEEEDLSPTETDTVAQGRRLRALLLLAAAALAAFVITLRSHRLPTSWRDLRELAGATREAASTEVPDLAALPPQQQAEELLGHAAAGSLRAAQMVVDNAAGWRGHIRPSDELRHAENVALGSPHALVRAAAIEVDLVASGLAKNPATIVQLTLEAGPRSTSRPWALWSLGLLAARGVEQDRVRELLLSFAHDPSEEARYWAAGALAFAGGEEVISPLLGMLRHDPSPRVRRQAARCLASCGTLQPEVRRLALPELTAISQDKSLPEQTRKLAATAAQEIASPTGRRPAPHGERTPPTRR